MANENNNQLVSVDTSGSMIPSNAAEKIAQAKQMLELNKQLLEELLQPKVDFDRIPGTDRPTLLKPGAEMLCRVYGLAQGNMAVTDKTEDWEHGIFCYTVTCPLVHIASGNVVAVGIGAANSHEVKYRYRNKYDNETQEKIRTENADPADNINTLIKMASKRAFVDAVLKATCASRIFTQDLEDMGHFNEPASSKQISFIRNLCGNNLETVKQILGKNITKFEEIQRTEASAIIDKLKSQANSEPAPYQPNDYNPEPQDGYQNSQPQQNDVNLVCADCGAKITSAEQKYSTNKFGRALCRNCQNKARNGG